MSGPDFLIIGLEEAGTSLLYDFLTSSPRIWMPHLRELHHFDRGAYADGAAARRDRLADMIPKCRAAEAKAGGAAAKADFALKAAFLEAFVAYFDGGQTDELYLQLFGVAPQGALTGDLAPGVSRLPLGRVRRIRAMMPGVKPVLALRDPVEWRIAMLRRRARAMVAIAPGSHRMTDEERQAAEAAEFYAGAASFLADPPINQLDYISSDFVRWRGVFGGDGLITVFYEDLICDPGRVAANVAETLGLPPEDAGEFLMATPEPRPLEEAVHTPALSDVDRARLVEILADELRRCRSVIGERADVWLEINGVG